MTAIGILIVVYIVATWLTEAYFMGDTWIYVDDTLKAQTLGATFWDFGHPLWRPFAWLVARMSYPLTRIFVGEDQRVNATVALMAINWLAGLVTMVIVYFVAASFSVRKWVPLVIAVTFLLSNAILNYAQTGQPYVPGLGLMFLGLYLLLRDGERPGKRSALLAGVALALGVCQWLPLALSVPAIVLSPIFLFGFDKARVRHGLQTSVVCGLTLIMVLAAMAIHLGVSDMAGFKTWIGSSAHGVLPDAPLKAILRMVFALARNLINMGNDGRLFKRYVANDPFNPVPFSELFGSSLWKLALFYLFLASVIFNLALARLGRKALALLLLNAIPLLLFAILLFESGSIDRYLPLFPMLFLSFSVALGSASPRWTRIVAVVFVGVAALSNLSAMSSSTLSREQARVADRIRHLQPSLKPESRVVTVNQQDEVYAFKQNFLFDPLNRSGSFEADMLVDPGTTQIDNWKQIFASKTLRTWSEGGDVWITARVFSQKPRVEWNWVEGDDPRISWKDLTNYFSSLEFGAPVGGDDGFVRLLPSEGNKKLLEAHAKERDALPNSSNEATGKSLPVDAKSSDFKIFLSFVAAARC